MQMNFDSFENSYQKNQLFLSRSDWLLLTPDCSLAEVDGNRSLRQKAPSNYETLMFHHDQRTSLMNAEKDYEWNLRKQLAKVALMTKKESLFKMPVVLSQIPNTSKFLEVSVRKKSEWSRDH